MCVFAECFKVLALDINKLESLLMINSSVFLRSNVITIISHEIYFVHPSCDLFRHYRL